MPTNDALSEAALNAFSNLLNDSTEVLEIEILPTALLPPDGPPYIRDDKYVGVSKKALAVAYKPAVTALFRTNDGKSGRHNPSNVC